MKKPFDVGVIIPLEEELETFFEEFPPKHDLSDALTLIHEVETGSPDISMVVIHQNGMGHAEAGESCSELLSRFDVNLVVCLGIAGGLSKDLSLGDVCYPTTVFDVLENSKAVDTENPSSQYEMELSSKPYNTDLDILQALNFFRTQPELKSLREEWEKNREKVIEEMNVPMFIGRSGKKEKLQKPKTANGSIITGAVSQSQKYNEKLKKLDRKVLAIETEAAPIYKRCQKNLTKCITIRGVSDFADINKGRLEGQTKNKIRSLAAANASSFLKTNLKNKWFVNAIKDTEKNRQKELNLPHSNKGKLLDTKSIITDVQQIIETNLNEYSPGHRFNSDGYTMPSPRLRKRESYTYSRSLENIEVNQFLSEVIQIEKRILISIPKGYPDLSLPWVFSQELLTSEVDGRQVIPLVIDCSALAPPRKGLTKLSDIDISEGTKSTGKKYVFILLNVPYQSKTRMTFLKKELERNQDGIFIFVHNNTTEIIAEVDVKNDFSLSIYDVCKVPFVEIAKFLKGSFAMDIGEAEVVAKRLWDTFSEFDLSAHPTYFAGIPRQTLLALLEANKRSELLQLAVDGYMSVVVSEDKSFVSLSRTKRTEFLSEVAKSIHVDKDIVDRNYLIDKLEKLSETHDYDIDPIGFIDTFQKCGVLHFEDGILKFSITYVEQYLLAKSLVQDESAACSYFNLDDFGFDPQVFDIYCEMKPHNKLKDKLFEEIKKAEERLSKFIGAERVLLTNEIEPRKITSQRNFDNLVKDLQNLHDGVSKDTDHVDEKQKALDLSEKIQEFTIEEATQQTDGKVDKESKEIDEAAKVFFLAVLLLGSGAEHLLASEKRKLSKHVVRLGTDIIDVWTRIRLDVDYEDIGKKLLKELRAFASPKERIESGNITEKDLKEFVDWFIKKLEEQMLVEPLGTILHILCEEARSPMLAQSLEHTSPEGVFESLLHATWIADVDPGRGKKFLPSSVGDVPIVPFLRYCMAQHFISRAYWSHWKKEDRLYLLDSANLFLKPFRQSVDKETVMKQIENTESGEI